MIIELKDEDLKSLYLAARKRGLSEGKALENVVLDLIYSGNPEHAIKGIRICFAVTMGSDIEIDDFYYRDEPAEIIILKRDD